MKSFFVFIISLLFLAKGYCQQIISYSTTTYINPSELSNTVNRLQAFADYIYKPFKVKLDTPLGPRNDISHFDDGVWGRGFYTKWIDNYDFIPKPNDKSAIMTEDPTYHKFRVCSPIISYSARTLLFYIYSYKSATNRTVQNLTRIKAGLNYLITQQQDNGGFIQYHWRNGMYDPLPLPVNGDPQGNMVTSYSTANALRVLFEGYYFISSLNDPSNNTLLNNILLTIRKAANYLQSIECSEGNNNYKCFSIFGLASAYKLTGEKQYLNRAVFKYEEIKGNQNSDGAWQINGDFHDTHPCYMGIIMRGLAELYSIVPDIYGNVKNDIKQSIVKTINNFLIPGIRKNGGPTDIRLDSTGKIFPYKDETEYINNSFYALQLIQGLKYVLEYNILTNSADIISVTNFLKIIEKSHLDEITNDNRFVTEPNLDAVMSSIGLINGTNLLPVLTIPSIEPASEVFGLNSLFSPQIPVVKSTIINYNGSASLELVGTIIADFQGIGKDNEPVILGLNKKTKAGFYLDILLDGSNSSHIYTSANNAYLRAITAGDIDGDGKSEIITAIHNTTDNIDRIYSSKFNGSSLTDTKLLWENSGFEVKALTTGDFERSGIDKLIIGFKVISTNAALVHSSSVDNNGNFSLKGKIYPETTGWEITTLAAGDFDGKGYDDLILGFNVVEYWSPGIPTYKGAAVYKSYKGIRLDKRIYGLNSTWKISALDADNIDNSSPNDELILGFNTITSPKATAIYVSKQATGTLNSKIFGTDVNYNVYSLASGRFHFYPNPFNKSFPDVQWEQINILKYFKLSQNYPNPFNPTSFIKYDLPEDSRVQIKVYDILGNEVVELVNEEKPAGSYVVKFNASNLPSGVYIYRMQAGKFMETKKTILLK